MNPNKSKIIKAEGFSWKGVEKREYKTDTQNFKDVHRFTLLGKEISDLNFQTRYFEIAPHGYSSLEMHRHPHSVIIIRGSGTLILENEVHELDLYDTIFIGPDTIHQFLADKNEPLGFICIVDRYRDKPRIPDKETIKRRITSPDVLNKLRI